MKKFYWIGLQIAITGVTPGQVTKIEREKRENGCPVTHRRLHSWLDQEIYLFHNYMVGFGVFTLHHTAYLCYISPYNTMQEDLGLEQSIQLVVSCSQAEVNNISCQ